MAVIKCKMCGGDIELAADKTFGTCEFCGSTMTLPKLDDEQRTAAFNRGNHFRRIGEFDKALAVYERIVREDDTDAEAHWCCALCRFGIEYVEDPTTYEWVPTCHRASFDSFLEDVDYKAALSHSDGITLRQYMKDGAKIAEVQRGILATSQNAEPYDVFICYKESDENGNRTRDSLMAQDIYYQLTEQGRKVFFSRITLEDIAGTQYEPYIFAALHSAKVMIVVGTKPEYLNAVWVRNEWSRFLALMKKDRHKLLLPCYRDMDPYDMPEQLSVLQSYDMAKIGFIQDLTRGIAKVLDAEKKPERVKETVVVQQSNNQMAPLLRRAALFLEDGDWQSADEYCEKVLDMDPECAEAYLGKLMVELRLRKRDALKDCAEPFDGSNNYRKIIRFGDEKLKATLQGYIDHINTRNERARLEGIYVLAVGKMSQAKTEDAYLDICAAFESISGYKDSTALADECRQKAQQRRIEAQKAAENKRKDSIYRDAKVLMGSKQIGDYRLAIEAFAEIPGWKDSDELIALCQRRIEEIEARKVHKQKPQVIPPKKSKLPLILLSLVLVVIAGAILINSVIIPSGKYNDAVALMEAGSYEEAIAIFEALGDYKDSAERAAECSGEVRLSDMYQEAVYLRDSGYTLEALRCFTELGNYKDAKTQANTLRKDYQKFAQPTSISAGNWAELSRGAAGDGYSVAVKKDGTVVAAGNTDSARCSVSGWHDIVAVSTGSNHTVGLMRDGTVVVAGTYPNIWCNVSDWTDIVAVSADVAYTLGLKDDGTVVADCDNTEGLCVGQCDVSDWQDIIAISTGYWHAVGLKADGTVVAAGGNDLNGYDYGQRDVSNWTDIVAISAGARHTVGLKSDGTVVATGLNSRGQCNVYDWTDIVAISAGNSHTIGLKADGTVVATGWNEFDQCNVSDWTDIVAVSAAAHHTIGLKSNGTMVAAGDNRFGQCNVSEWTDIKTPTATGISINNNSEVLEAQYLNAIALRDSGYTLEALRSFTELGDYSDAKAQANELRKLYQKSLQNLSISVSGSTYGIKTDGTILFAGTDSNGLNEYVFNWTDIVSLDLLGWSVLGLKKDGTVNHAGYAPSGAGNVHGWRDIVAISAGSSHTTGLKSDGTVVATGMNREGECNVSDWKNIIAISAGGCFTVGLRADGTVVAVGDTSDRGGNTRDGACDVDEWTDIIAISTGMGHTVGLKADGTVVAAGGKNYIVVDHYEQHDVSGWTDIVAISTGYWHTVGLKADGTVVATGWNEEGQCNVSDWTDIVAISAGQQRTVGLKADGTVVAVGNNDKGQLDVSGWTDIKLPEGAGTAKSSGLNLSVRGTAETISAGGFHTLAVKADGTVATAGSNFHGVREVSDWTDIVAVSAGSSHSIGLKSNGTVVTAGSAGNNRANVNTWSHIIAISTGMSHSVGLRSDGTVVAVGSNTYGECNVFGWNNIVAIGAGDGYTIGLQSNGTVLATGLNEDNQCNVNDWTDIVAISAGSMHAVGLKSDGTVVATGRNSSSQCDVTGWRDIVGISAGGVHTVGLKSDGSVVAVGSNNSGACNVTDWKDVILISAGGSHTVGMKKDGTIIAAGNNLDGECDVSGWTDIKIPEGAGSADN